jgi:RNA polymerase sigma-70 factor, ECF subfamily
MQSTNRFRGDPEANNAILRALHGCDPLLEDWAAQSGAHHWGLTTERFTTELARCAAARLKPSAALDATELQTYLSTLHLEDLALACACADGVPDAWEHFFKTYRGYLRACAATMLKRGANSPEAEELADSLFADLYGLSAEKRGSLLRYFHGRSSLKTWLRAVLAQRHVDKIRAGRRFEELNEEQTRDADSGTTSKPTDLSIVDAVDPHREKYLALFTRALEMALKNLDSEDSRRLRMYYAEEKKLAEIGRAFGEHESSASRHLEKARRDLRQAVEEILRTGSGLVDGASKGLSDAQIALCFEYASQDAPIDLDKLFAPRDKPGKPQEGKDL